MKGKGGLVLIKSERVWRGAEGGGERGNKIKYMWPQLYIDYLVLFLLYGETYKKSKITFNEPRKAIAWVWQSGVYRINTRTRNTGLSMK